VTVPLRFCSHLQQCWLGHDSPCHARMPVAVSIGCWAPGSMGPAWQLPAPPLSSLRSPARGLPGHQVGG
jgi:hypothetical protein